MHDEASSTSSRPSGPTAGSPSAEPDALARSAPRGPVGKRAPAVPRAVFSVNGVAARERYDVWHDSIACIFDVDAKRDVRAEDFHAEVDAHMLGPLMLARTASRNQLWCRTPEIMARDGMDHFMIQLYESGDMRWSTPTGDRNMPKNGLVVFDLAQPVTVTTDDFSNLSLIVPRHLLEPHLKSRDGQHLRVLDGREPMVDLLRDHMASLKRLAQRMTLAQASEVAPVTVGLTAACLNGAIDDRPEQMNGVATAQLTRLRRLIEANLSNPELSSNWIARQGGVSRSKLYTLFAPFDGVATYIRERRLRRALLQLAVKQGDGRTIYQVAGDAGYSSEGAFTRAFTARYGVTPSELRRSGEIAENRPDDPDGLDRRYENWLLHLGV